MADGTEERWLVAGSTDPQEVAVFYDRWAARYDADLNDWSYKSPAVVARLATQHAPAAKKILDAGCGTGLSGRALRDAGFEGDLHGVDVSEQSLAIARSTGAYSSVGFADLQQPLEFADDSFDALVCVGVMTYVPEVESCWRDFCRVVSPGGVIVVTQRTDMWESRACADVVDRLVADGTWSTIWLSDPEQYLPGSDEWDDEIGVRYVVARVG